MKRHILFLVSIFAAAYLLTLGLAKLAHATPVIVEPHIAPIITPHVVVEPTAHPVIVPFIPRPVVAPTHELVAIADGSGSERPSAEAGSGSGSAVTPTPADSLHDPVSDPKATYDDLKAAKTSGWPVLVFGIVLVVGRLLGRLGKTKSIAWLAKLGTGKLAVGIAGAVAVAAAGYNTAFAHGSPWAILAAVVAAAMTAFNPHADATTETKA